MNGEHTKPVESRTEDPDLLTRLANLCVCASEEKCLYCESRERIEAQDRTLRLAQQKLASLQLRASRAEEQLAAELKWRRENSNV